MAQNPVGRFVIDDDAATASPKGRFVIDSEPATVGNVAKNVALGALKGASDIGTTLLKPVDALTDAVMGDRGPNVSGLVTGKQPLTRNQERRQQLADFFKQNADPESLSFKGGELGADIAGTAGLGGLLGKGAQLLGASPKIIAALESGGFKLGSEPATTLAGKASDAALRTVAGGATGAAAAGLVNPEDAGTGAAIGAALPGGVKAAGLAGGAVRSAAEHILGAMTGTSAETVKGAFQAGKQGATDFLENMRGKVPFEDIVDRAKQGLQNMRAERGKQYRSGMVDIKGDKSVLDMAPIVDSVKGIQSAGNFKGKVINEKASGTLGEIADKVNDWAKSNPSEFHTPEGLDALKQAIGDIRDSTQFGTPARRAADNVYNSIKQQIQSQAPTYSKVMKDYSEASNTISEIERALSLGSKGAKDTAVRKLQSLMRNNAQTNYGNRLQLGRELEEKGGVELTPSIAGQAMSSLLPRGMTGAMEKAGALGIGAGALHFAPGALALAPLTSPRLVGEAAYGAGRISGAGSRALSALTGKKIGGESLGKLEESALRNPALRNALIQAYANQNR